MTASALTTARPLTAAIAWATRDAIFVEIPCRDGPPYIARYHKTAEGLAAALNIICETPETTPRTVPVDHPTIKRAKPHFDETERGTVRSILKKAGVI